MVGHFLKFFQSGKSLREKAEPETGGFKTAEVGFPRLRPGRKGKRVTREI
jgi:hypothetical protein